MSIISNEYINSVINNIAEALELKEWTCNKQSFDKIAQNYFGVIIPIYLSGQRDNKTVNIPIVLKLAPTDERYRVSGAVGIFFAKEVFVYRKVLHRYGEIQKNYPLIQFVMPECYYFRDDHCHELIAMQNMCERGFKPFDNLPTSACIIDYQTTRIGSPAFDVLFLIITSTTSCLRKKHFKHLLDVYYETFQLTLKYANMNSEEIYSREMLDYDLGIVGPSCFIVANTAMWLASGLQEEGHVRSKIVLNTDAERTEAVIKYKNIISGIIDDLSDNNYIHSVFL
ncbi:uncharacterized protein LOC112047363 isoform X2 [Bicyclus anynana]|uniref:Uncharacterized protein LOC112047363 isoform X2 n=1 Tax=Bicyclus anynana TaxID=110368 RepID=A0ABM3LYZ5_BICAN|nr:uncharacterized protein LOC112047363 isoform X2 [Bicyclus anynana]